MRTPRHWTRSLHGMTVHQDDPLETRVGDLERDLGHLIARVTDLVQEVLNLRARVNVLLPERHHCRYCKALVSEHSTACGACGRQLRVPDDPKTGMPR